MLIEDHAQFSNWLTKELAPISDAEPGALAKYVMALLKKPEKTDDEIRELCMQQLDVFLSASTNKFVEKLFTALHEKSYMPRVEKPTERHSEKSAEKERPKSKEKENDSKSSAPRDDRRRAPPLTGANASDRKDKDERHSGSSTASRREEPKRDIRKRISAPDNTNNAVSGEKRERRRSRSPARERRSGNGKARSPERRHRDTRKRSRSRSAEKTDKKRRQRCKDYDEKGFCMQGDRCQFDHGPDPVVVDDDAMNKMNMLKRNGPNFSVPPPGFNPPPPGIAPPMTEGYNPEAPALGYSVPPPPIPMHAGWRGAPPQGSFPNPPPNQVGYDPAAAPMDGGHPMRGGGRGRGRGRGMGRFQNGGHPAATAQTGAALAPSVAAKSLSIAKIPPELNNIAKLNEHFAQFGNIVNLQVHHEGRADRALITFSSRGEAMQAHKSEAPILNNRFIKVFWYNPEAEANPQRTVLNSGVSVEKPVPIPVNKPVDPASLPKPGETTFADPKVVEKRERINALKRKMVSVKEHQARQLDLHRRQTELLTKMLDQQKKVIQMCQRVSDDKPEDKKKTFAMLKTIGAKVEEVKKELASKKEALDAAVLALEEAKREFEAETGKKEASPVDEEAGSPAPNDKADTEDPAPLVLVCGFGVDDEDRLTKALEALGEVEDMNVVLGGQPSATVRYKNKHHAELLVSEGLTLEGEVLTVSWLKEEEEEDL